MHCKYKIRFLINFNLAVYLFIPYRGGERWHRCIHCMLNLCRCLFRLPGESKPWLCILSIVICYTKYNEQNIKIVWGITVECIIADVGINYNGLIEIWGFAININYCKCSVTYVFLADSNAIVVFVQW